MTRQKIAKLIQKSIKELQEEKKLPKFETPEIKIEHPEEKAHGDYATNIAMVICRLQPAHHPPRLCRGPSGFTRIATPKDAETKPVKIAHILVAKLKEYKENHYLFEKIEVKEPGFINFFLSKNVLVNELEKILKEKEKYGSSKIGKGKTVIVDYSGPNIAKPFGIGHLRSTIIGQALYNIYKFLAFKCIGDNHLGDWGTQYGKLIVAIKKWGRGIKEFSIEDLEKLYVKFHQKAELNPELEEEARNEFKKLEKGDREAKRIWKICLNTSLKEFERIYKLLGVKIDYAFGESFYQPMLKDIIEEAKKKKIAFESQGALIIQYPNNELPPAMLLKSDGATTYLIRDLATIKFRLKKWKPDLIIYEVGADQTLHFKQLFKAVELLGWPAFAKASAGKAKKVKFFHVAHGLIRTKTGKFSTRKGETVHLEKVLKEAILRAKEIIEKSETGRGLSDKEKEKVAKVIGIGAVKYNDLKQHPSKDIIFSWEKVLNLKGNSGPYLQYTFARCQSVLRKAKFKINFKKLRVFNFNEEEEEILREIYKFPEVIEESVEKFSPNLISNFIFNLAQKYNIFYDLHPIIKAENLKQKEFRLSLTSALSQVLKNALNLLGISAPAKM